MDDKLEIGIPDDEAATAPKQRFRVLKANSWLLSKGLLPLALLGIGAFGSKLLGPLNAKPAEAAGSAGPAPHDDREAALAEYHETEDDPPMMLDRQAGGSGGWNGHPADGGGHVVNLADVRGLRSTLSEYQQDGAGDPVFANFDDVIRFAESDPPQAPSVGGEDPSGPVKVGAKPEDPAGGAVDAGAPGATEDDEEDDENGKGPGAANQAPRVGSVVRLPSGRTNEAFLLTSAILLGGAVDPDGDALSVRDLRVDHGTVTQRPDGSWLFVPDKDYGGEVTFSYAISDGEASVAQTALSDLLPTPGKHIAGTEGDDMLIGTPWDDVIDGFGGDDILYGRAGDDVIHGGAGNDRIVGGDGDDVIYGNDGADVIYAGAGNDFLFGGAGDDRLYGEEGNDIVMGGAGSDQLFGGEGNDTLDGGSGADVVEGGAGDDLIVVTTLAEASGDSYDGGEGTDTLDLVLVDENVEVDLSEGELISETVHTTIQRIENVTAGLGDDQLTGDGAANVLIGGGGNDTIDGGAGNDTLEGGSGADVVEGGAGDDRVLFTRAADSDGDSYDGGAGVDTLDASRVDTDIAVDLDSGEVLAEGAISEVHEVENVVAGSGDDTIVANASVNVMSGGAGQDSFVFKSLEALRNDGEGHDRITDFEAGDRIDLSHLALEREDFKAIKLYFSEVGSAGILTAGAVYACFDDADEGQASVTRIKGYLGHGDDDSGEDVEFEIDLDGHHEMSEHDFWFETGHFG